MKCSNCTKGVIFFIVVIALCVAIILEFRLRYSRINIPRRLGENAFKEFIQKFNRNYENDPVEYQKRYNIFMVSSINKKKKITFFN